MWPLYVAADRQFFQREGVDVQVVFTGASGKQLAGLIRGDYDIGLQQSDHVVRAVEQGSDLFIFMAHAHQPVLSLVVKPGVRGFNDLRGRVVAVDGARTGYALIQRQLLARQGLGERDYNLIEAGGVQARYEALKSGVAVAAWLNPPYDQWLIDLGFSSLGTVTDYFPDYPGSVAAARRSWARANEAELVAFIRAHNAAYAWLLAPGNRGEAEKIAMAHLKTDAQQTQDAYRQFLASPRPDITPASLQIVIDAVWDSERLPVPRGAPPKYMDLSYFSRA
jgi:ABC-type nitrate/sulfonate/bicarbonate transport system substrate-binding protein